MAAAASCVLLRPLPAAPAHLALPPQDPNQLVKGDIQSMDLLTFVLSAEKIDTIMHFAAQVRCASAISSVLCCKQSAMLQRLHTVRLTPRHPPPGPQTHVDNSFGNSLAFTMNNTYGTHVVLEAARKAGTIRRFINVYGETSLGKEEGEYFNKQAVCMHASKEGTWVPASFVS